MPIDIPPENETAAGHAAPPAPTLPILPILPTLPALALLMAAPFGPPDAGALEQALAQADPAGRWRARAVDGALRLEGAGGALLLGASGGAELPARVAARSLWLQPGEAAGIAEAQRASLWLRALPGAQADSTGRRRLALAMAVLVAQLVAVRPVLAVLNADRGLLFPARLVPALLAPLAAGEVPLQLFVAIACHGVRAGAISLASEGLQALVGHELEVCEAPGSLAEVAALVEQVARYLLAAGPVIGAGDTLAPAGSGAPWRAAWQDRAVLRLLPPPGVQQR